MRKRLQFIGSIFTAAIGMMLGLNPVPSNQYTVGQKQVSEQSGPTGKETSKQQLVPSDLAFALRATDRDYDFPFFYTNRNNRQRKWCNSFRAGHSNRIKLSRNTRRKHRRA